MASSVASWSCGDVEQWLRDNGFPKYGKFFLEHGLNGEGLLSLQTEHLVYLVKIFDDIFCLNDVLKFEQHLKKLKEFSSGGDFFPSDQDGMPAASASASNEAKWHDGGFEEIVRFMSEAYPQHCWRYKVSEIILKDYIPPLGNKTAAKGFPATATHVISPVDFYVQPALIQATVKKMEQLLQQEYSEQVAAVPPESVYVGMPCVVRSKQDGNWYRAQLVDVIGAEEAPVKFVDWGHRQYSPLDDMKPLLSQFGRFPPAAVRCRIQGVRERTLEQKVLDSFHTEMNNLGCEVILKIVSASSESLLVEIFNQYTNENIGLKYLPKEPICPKLPSLEALKKNKERERAAKEAILANKNAADAGGVKVFASDMDAFMEGAFDAYSSSDDGQTGDIKRMNKKYRKIKHEESLQAQKKGTGKPEEEERIVKLPTGDISIQRRFRKQRKPLIGRIDVRISHVESAQEIYLHVLPLEEDFGDIQDTLSELYGGPNDSVLALPEELTMGENACVVYESIDQAWYRCKVAEMNFNSLVLQAVDFGKRLPPIPRTESVRIKVLLADPRLCAVPKAYYCRVDQLCDNAVSITETRLLKELLPVGAVLKAEFDRSREPWRVALFDAKTNTNFVDTFNEELEKRGFAEIVAFERRPCKDVAVWRKPVYVEVTGLNDKEHSGPTVSGSQAGSNRCRGNVETADTEKANAKKLQTDHGYANDIEAVLCGSVAVAGYDSDDDNEKLTGGGFRAKQKAARVVECDEDDNDEKASVTEFPEEKKQLVSKWLEESSKENSVPTTVACANPTVAPKRVSVAALYNPDLARRPINQKNTVCQEIEPAKQSRSSEAFAVNETKPRLPVKSSDVRLSIAGEFR